MEIDQRRDPRSSPVAWWGPVVLIVVVLVLVFVVRVAARGGGGGTGSVAAPRNPGAVPRDDLVVPVAPIPAVTIAPAAPPAAVVLGRTLGVGATGEDVRAVESRLSELGFVPGPVDGVFDEETLAAVWAYEKVAFGTPNALVTGRITQDTWVRMHQAISVAPRRVPAGTHVEIDLSQQLAVVYREGMPVLITHVSAGNGLGWCVDAHIDTDRVGVPLGDAHDGRLCGVADTPGGVFRIYRALDGWRSTELGTMYRPMYVNFGVAIYGATEVPSAPATLGGISVPIVVADELAGVLGEGDLVYIWDGVEQPEDQTDAEMLPVFPQPPPDGA